MAEMRIVWMIVACAGLITVSGCKQGIGDRCQVESDCDDGLDCILPPGGAIQSGGICQPPNDDAGTDGGIQDSGSEDLGPDASAIVLDLSTTD